MKNAKALITGEVESLNEDPQDRPPGARPPGGAMGRQGGRGPMGRPGGPGGEGRPGMEEPQGLLDRRERQTFKDLVLVDLLTAMGGDPFYAALVDAAIKGEDPDQAQIRHFMDEAGKFGARITPDIHALLTKLSKVP